VKVLFYSIWNIAYQAKNCELYKECQIMLRQLYETVKKFSAFFAETHHNSTKGRTIFSRGNQNPVVGGNITKQSGAVKDEEIV
jgi:hypothetical protein